MNRLIVLDTETTGLSPSDGHRIVEIGAVEIVDRIITGRHYQAYINPERKCDIKAFEVHQLTDKFLAKQPKFASVVEEFLAFITDGALVIHNSDFDMGFINHELRLARYPALKNNVIDTLRLAKSELAGVSKHSLDALCDYFKIDRSHRTAHGALLDSNILADVYLQMIRKQIGLDINSFDNLQYKKHWKSDKPVINKFQPNTTNLDEHDELIKTLSADSPTLWTK